MGREMKMKGTWFEVTQYADTLGEKVFTLPSGQRYQVRGPVEDVMIVVIPHNDMHQMSMDGSLNTMLDAVQMTIRGGGFEGGVLIVPDSIRFMKLNPVDRITSKMLEQRDARQRVALSAADGPKSKKSPS